MLGEELEASRTSVKSMQVVRVEGHQVRSRWTEARDRRPLSGFGQGTSILGSSLWLLGGGQAIGGPEEKQGLVGGFAGPEMARISLLGCCNNVLRSE